jgi:hypothetical protein
MGEVAVVNRILKRIPRAARAATAVALVAMLGGCGAMVADLPVVGLPEGAPGRPADPGAFPAVHDIPAAREEAPLDAAERDRIERELTTARDRQNRATRD